MPALQASFSDEGVPLCDEALGVLCEGSQPAETDALRRLRELATPISPRVPPFQLPAGRCPKCNGTSDEIGKYAIACKACGGTGKARSDASPEPTQSGYRADGEAPAPAEFRVRGGASTVTAATPHGAPAPNPFGESSPQATPGLSTPRVENLVTPTAPIFAAGWTPMTDRSPEGLRSGAAAAALARSGALASQPSRPRLPSQSSSEASSAAELVIEQEIAEAAQASIAEVLRLEAEQEAAAIASAEEAATTSADDVSLSFPGEVASPPAAARSRKVSAGSEAGSEAGTPRLKKKGAARQMQRFGHFVTGDHPEYASPRDRHSSADAGRRVAAQLGPAAREEYERRLHPTPSYTLSVAGEMFGNNKAARQLARSVDSNPFGTASPPMGRADASSNPFGSDGAKPFETPCAQRDAFERISQMANPFDTTTSSHEGERTLQRANTTNPFGRAPKNPFSTIVANPFDAEPAPAPNPFDSTRSSVTTVASLWSTRRSSEEAVALGMPYSAKGRHRRTHSNPPAPTAIKLGAAWFNVAERARASAPDTPERGNM